MIKEKIIINDPKEISLEKDIKPLLLESLDKNGYFVIKPVFLDNESCTEGDIGRYITSLFVYFTKLFSDKIGFYELSGQGDKND